MNITHKKKLIEKYGINNPEVIAELEKRGLLVSLKKDDVNQLLGRTDIPCGGLKIVYPNSPEVFTIRMEQPFAPDTTQKERKYLKPAGQPNSLYIPYNLGNIEKLPEIWIVEGEMKALCGAVLGLPTVAIPGIWSWRGDDQSEASQISKLMGSGATSDIDDSNALIKDLRFDYNGKKIVLLFDSDIDQSHPGYLSYLRFAEELYARGAESVKILIAPEVDGFEKTGLDDLFVAASNNGISTEAVIADLKAKIADIPVFLPRGKGAEIRINQLLSKGDDLSKSDKVMATAIVAAKEGKTRGKEFAKKFGNQKSMIYDDAMYLLKKCQRYYTVKIKRDNLNNLPHIIKEACVLNAVEGLSNDLFKDVLFESVYETFSGSGEFYRSENNETFYNYKNQIISLDSKEFETLFTNKSTYPIRSSDKGRYIFDRMKARVLEEAQWVDLKMETFYDKKRNNLYLFQGNGQMLKITPHSKPEVVGVGTDDILFKADESMEPWKYVNYSEEDEQLFRKVLLGYNFSEKNRISRANIEILILAWIASNRFRELNPTHLIPVFRGEKGSGKTSLGNSIIRILKGSAEAVRAIDLKKKDQVLNVLTHETIAVFDNMDTQTHDIEDIIAISATGGIYQTRAYYSTNDTVKYRLIAWLIITSRTPAFLRDDIVDRLLPLDFERFEEVIPESQIIEMIAKKRNEFQSIIVDICQNIILHIEKEGVSTQIESLRMADFSSFLRTYLQATDPENGNALCDTIIQELQLAQQYWLIDNDPIIECVRSLIEDNTIETNRRYKGTEINTKIKLRAQENMIRLELRDTRALYDKMRERKQALKNLCGITFEESSPHGVVHMTFMKE